jgi:hypothetical protein
MKLRATIVRPFAALFQRRVQVTAYCEKTKRAVSEPHVGCGECHALPFKVEVRD